MIPEAFALRQTMRFHCLREAPKTEIGLQELVTALRRYAATEEHAIRIVEKWIASNQFAPTPIDIADTAESVPASNIKLKKDRDCPACYGTGWEVVYTLDTYEVLADGSCYKRREIIPDQQTAGQLQTRVDGKKQVVYSNARRCTQCNYGKTLTSESGARNPEQKPAPELPLVDESKLPEFGPAKAKPPKKANETTSRPLRFITAEDVERARREAQERKENEGPANESSA